MEPPNEDIFYVKDNLKEVLLRFKSFETSLSVSPIVKDLIMLIRGQSLEFRECIKMSIAQSINLEKYSKNVLSYADALEDPVFDLENILNVLETLLGISQKNMQETEEIKNKFEAIKNALVKINNDTYVQHRNLKNSLQEREWLRTWETIYSVIMVANFLVTGLIWSGILDTELSVGAAFMVLSSFVTVHCLKTKNESKIKRLDELETQLRNLELSQNNLDKICDDVYNMAVQMVTFNTYWSVQARYLGDIESGLKNERNITDADQIKRILNGPMKENWDSVRVLCDNYTRTVRGLLEDVRN